jgi:hypothetical protein
VGLTGDKCDGCAPHSHALAHQLMPQHDATFDTMAINQWFAVSVPHFKFLHCCDPHGLSVNGYQGVILGTAKLQNQLQMHHCYNNIYHGIILGTAKLLIDRQLNHSSSGSCDSGSLIAGSTVLLCRG